MKKQMVTISQILDYLEAKAKRGEKLTEAEYDLTRWADGEIGFDDDEEAMAERYSWYIDEDFFLDSNVMMAMQQDRNFNNFMRDKIFVIRLTPRG